MGLSLSLERSIQDDLDFILWPVHTFYATVSGHRWDTLLSVIAKKEKKLIN